MASIVLKNVSKFYKDKPALHNFTFSFTPETTTAVIGPSGSGKSTLLQLINGLLRPDSGEVRVFGQPLDYGDLPTLRSRIGYAVQGTGLFPHLQVDKNISLLAHLLGWGAEKIQARLHELMNLVDLPAAYSSKYPHQLSGGEQQRVGLCRAMMLNPRIFLLDEPFGALDPLTRAEIHREFLKLQKLEARTILLVTHDLREALKLARQVVILNNGKIEQVGARDEILRNPASEFVSRFVHMQLEDDVQVAGDSF